MHSMLLSTNTLIQVTPHNTPDAIHKHKIINTICNWYYSLFVWQCFCLLFKQEQQQHTNLIYGTIRKSQQPAEIKRKCCVCACTTMYTMCNTYCHSMTRHTDPAVRSSVLTVYCVSAHLYFIITDKCKSFRWKIFDKYPSLQSAHALPRSA